MAEIIGDGTSQTLAGGADGDIIEGRGGSDFLVGRGGDDIIKGGSGADFILGGAGEDTILGGTGRDILFGGRGDDIINGGSGADTINGDFGADTLTGGSGNDNFVFKGSTAGVDADGNAAWDTITDFHVGDTLTFEDFFEFGLFNFEQVGDDVHVSVSSGIIFDPCFLDGDLMASGDYVGVPICLDIDIKAEVSTSVAYDDDLWMPTLVLDFLVVVVEDALVADVEAASNVGGHFGMVL